MAVFLSAFLFSLGYTEKTRKLPNLSSQKVVGKVFGL